jgi:hypothetical protein
MALRVLRRCRTAVELATTCSNARSASARIHWVTDVVTGGGNVVSGGGSAVVSGGGGAGQSEP